MPELPEVETVRRGLEQLVSGKQIMDVTIHNSKSFDAQKTIIKKSLINAKVKSVRRRAKVIIIDLSSDYSLIIHLKMTGQLVYRGKESWAAGHPTDSFMADLPDRSTRVEFYFCDTSKLFFNDQRKFGWVKLIHTKDVEKTDFIQKLGPEPLSGDPDLQEQFINNVRRHNNTTIKSALLNQSVVAGIGNIYADESLWASKIHPATRVRNLSDKNVLNILQNAIKIMTKSIEFGGSTIKNYVGADGKQGNHLEKFSHVYRLDGKPCTRCGMTIEKIRVAGRGTHICPKCQILEE